ncbi:hypothetical protein [Paraburkholderia bannensis]|uniref:hypothetical protein n=1 Tax=Paraburkholderia bannensis TaxID=765414 RepID=UPI002ABD3825|nr:hypothetical protein [Paraburkholderia bannensis]
MLRLMFYPNSRGVWVGDLYDDDVRLLATTHPATIAAAIFAMDGHSLRVETEDGFFEMQFPFEENEFDDIAKVLEDDQMGQWMTLFFTFSRFDFSNPLPYDTRAEIHFRAAVHHLPTELVKIRPSEPNPKGFKKQLKNRNQYIYYPWE